MRTTVPRGRAYRRACSSGEPGRRTSRREFLVGGTCLVLAAGAIAGCDGSGGGSASGARRTVEHAFGRSEIPVSPRRIVDLTGGAGVDQLLTLGLVPKASWGDPAAPNGACEWFDEVDWPEDVAAGEIENVAGADGVNVEKVAATEPDLILGWEYAFDGILDRLEEIAPCVGITPVNGPKWEQGFEKVAKVLGREARYRRWRESYDARLGELRAGMDGSPEDHTVSVLWNGDESAIYLYGKPSQPGSIVLDAGFRMPELAGIYDQISTEQFPEIDADAIFVMTNRKDIPERREDFRPTFADNELWQNLEAVKNGRVFPVEIYTWTNGGPTANRDVLLPQLFGVFGGG